MMVQKLTRTNFRKFNHDWDLACQFDYRQIESQNMDLDSIFYPGLGPAALYTSFADYYQLFSSLPDSVNHVVDLGAGVGRLAPIWKTLRPDGKVTLIEYVNSRYQAAQDMIQRLCLSEVTLVQEDLLQFKIPQADAYFIYLPVNKVLEKIIADISEMNHPCYIVAIESHGNLFSRLDMWTGLELKTEIPLFTERHHHSGRIYSFSGKKTQLSKMELILRESLNESILVIKDKKGQWIGVSKDLVMSKESEVLLKYPPRTVDESSILEVKKMTDFSAEVQSFIQKLRDEVVFEGSLIRKIWIAPTLKLEMQNGSILSLPSSY